MVIMKSANGTFKPLKTLSPLRREAQCRPARHSTSKQLMPLRPLR